MYIWFNPHLNIYQKGAWQDYQEITHRVENKESYMIIYELSELSSRLADKLLRELNSTRQLKKAV